MLDVLILVPGEPGENIIRDSRAVIKVLSQMQGS